MKRKVFVIYTTIFLLLFACFMGAIAQDKLNFDEPEQLKKFASYVKRDGATLYFKLKSGSYSALADKEECSSWDTCAAYQFLDYFKDVGFYLVDVGYYEGGEYLMISDKSGERYLVHDKPEISSDRRRFVTVSASESYDINGVFIWRFEGEKIISELSYEPKEYALYEFVKWDDNSIIFLSKYASADEKLCPDSNSMTVPVVLKRDNLVWKFHESLSKAKCEPKNR